MHSSTFLRSLPRFLLSLAIAATAPVMAQNYPAKPIRLIIPYAVGQGTDIAARYIGDQLALELKQAIVVDNKPGAGGNVGTQAAARSAPDGYTIMIGTNATHAANAFLYSNPGYDPQADFEPIAMAGILPLVFVAKPSSPVNSMSGLIRAARAKPDALNIAVSTTTCRLAYELFKARADAPMFPIDFKGSAQALTGILGDQVEFMVDTITSLRTAVISHQVKALGVTSAQSSKLLPGVKSLAEQGISGYELVGWTVFYAPKGTPQEALNVLSAAFDKVLARPDVQDKLLQLGIDPQRKSMDELKAFGQSEKEKWGQLIKAAGLKPVT